MSASSISGMNDLSAAGSSRSTSASGLDLLRQINEQAVFGPEEWQQALGVQVGEAPPVTDEITEAFKRWHETHLLIMIPETVDGRPFSLRLLPDSFGCQLIELEERPSTRIENRRGEIKKSYWVLALKKLNTEGLRCQYHSQMDFAKSYHGHGNSDAPYILEAVVMLLAIQSISNRWLVMEDWPHRGGGMRMACKERVAVWPSTDKNVTVSHDWLGRIRVLAKPDLHGEDDVVVQPLLRFDGKSEASPSVASSSSPVVASSSSDIEPADPRGRCDWLTQRLTEIWERFIPPSAQASCSETVELAVDPREELKQDKYSTSFFGKEHWEKHFGYVGEEPPLPEGIMDIMQSDCPWASSIASRAVITSSDIAEPVEPKKVYETHMLLLVPSTLQGRPLSINEMEAVILGGRRPQYPYGEDRGLEEAKALFGDQATPSSYWALVLKKPNIRRNDYEESLEDCRSKTLKSEHGHSKRVQCSYDVPTVLENTMALLVFQALGLSPELFSAEVCLPPNGGLVCREDPKAYEELKRFTCNSLLVLRTDTRGGIRHHVLFRDPDENPMLMQPIHRFNVGDAWRVWSAQQGVPLKDLGLSFTGAASSFVKEKALTTVNPGNVYRDPEDKRAFIAENPQLNDLALSQGDKRYWLRQLVQIGDFYGVGRLIDDFQTDPLSGSSKGASLLSAAAFNAPSTARRGMLEKLLRMGVQAEQAKAAFRSVIQIGDAEAVKLLLAYGARVGLEEIHLANSHRIVEILTHAPRPEVSRLFNLCLRVIARQPVDIPDWFPPLLLAADTTD